MTINTPDAFDLPAKKSASAHDFRRVFGTRWAAKLLPADLKLLMRHESIETTMRYYVGQEADEVAERLYREQRTDQTTAVKVDATVQ